MPCVISQDEINEMERQENLKLYGKRLLSEQVTEEVACEMARYLDATKNIARLSSMAQNWIARHKTKDAKHGRAWPEVK